MKGNEDKMSDDQEKAVPVEKKQKNFVKLDDVAQLADGITSSDKAAFRVYGPKTGTRLVVPLTQKIGRAFFYGKPVPEHAAIRVYTDEVRSDKRLGGITADVDFSSGSEAALEAIKLLADAVRAAPPPSKPDRKPKENDEENVG